MLVGQTMDFSRFLNAGWSRWSFFVTFCDDDGSFLGVFQKHPHPTPNSGTKTQFGQPTHQNLPNGVFCHYQSPKFVIAAKTANFGTKPGKFFKITFFFFQQTENRR